MAQLHGTGVLRGVVPLLGPGHALELYDDQAAGVPGPFPGLGLAPADDVASPVLLDGGADLSPVDLELVRVGDLDVGDNVSCHDGLLSAGRARTTAGVPVDGNDGRIPLVLY